MRFGFKIHLDDIAEKLIKKGFTSQQIDSDALTNAVVEFLQDDYDLFTALEEEMQSVEDAGNKPKTRAEYDESIGEF
jgi:DNA-binding ferritin-like protein